LHGSSCRGPAFSQSTLQYFSPSVTGQLQAGRRHLFVPVMTYGLQSTHHCDLDFLPPAVERIPDFRGFFYGMQSGLLKTILFNAVASFLQIRGV
jgi:hypothetical protein